MGGAKETRFEPEGEPMTAWSPIQDLLAGNPPGQVSRIAGESAGHLECLTLEIPPRCLELCSWVVVRAASPGKPMKSRLKTRNALCGAAHGKTV